MIIKATERHRGALQDRPVPIYEMKLQNCLAKSFDRSVNAFLCRATARAAARAPLICICMCNGVQRYRAKGGYTVAQWHPCESMDTRRASLRVYTRAGTRATLTHPRTHANSCRHALWGTSLFCLLADPSASASIPRGRYSAFRRRIHNGRLFMVSVCVTVVVLICATFLTDRTISSPFARSKCSTEIDYDRNARRQMFVASRRACQYFMPFKYLQRLQMALLRDWFAVSLHGEKSTI